MPKKTLELEPTSVPSLDPAPELVLVLDDGVLCTDDGEIVVTFPAEVPGDDSPDQAPEGAVRALSLWVLGKLHARDATAKSIERRLSIANADLSDLEEAARTEFESRPEVLALRSRLASLERMKIKTTEESAGLIARFKGHLARFVTMTANGRSRSVDTEWGRLALRRTPEKVAIADNDKAVALFRALGLHEAVKETAQVGAAKAEILLAYGEPDDLAPNEALARRDVIVGEIARHPGAVTYVPPVDGLTYTA